LQNLSQRRSKIVWSQIRNYFRPTSEIYLRPVYILL
jgi:hypothetical protein